MDELTQTVSSALAAIAAAASLAELDEQRVRYLGKKGELTQHLKQLGQLDPDARRARGAEINALKEQLEQGLAARKEQLEAQELARKLWSERVDVTLPGRRQAMGGLHPVTRTIERMEAFFESVGFEVVEGPGDRGRLAQLRGAEHPARASRARDARHLLHRPDHGAAHPHLAGAGAGHAVDGAADPRDLPGAGVPLRFRPHALADVPPGGRAGDRRGHRHAGSQGHGRRFPARLLRARSAR